MAKKLINTSIGMGKGTLSREAVGVEVLNTTVPNRVGWENATTITPILVTTLAIVDVRIQNSNSVWIEGSAHVNAYFNNTGVITCEARTTDLKGRPLRITIYGNAK